MWFYGTCHLSCLKSGDHSGFLNYGTGKCLASNLRLSPRNRLPDWEQWEVSSLETDTPETGPAKYGIIWSNWSPHFLQLLKWLFLSKQSLNNSTCAPLLASFGPITFAPPVVVTCATATGVMQTMESLFKSWDYGIMGKLPPITGGILATKMGNQDCLSGLSGAQIRDTSLST